MSPRGFISPVGCTQPHDSTPLNSRLNAYTPETFDLGCKSIIKITFTKRDCSKYFKIGKGGVSRVTQWSRRPASMPVGSGSPISNTTVVPPFLSFLPAHLQQALGPPHSSQVWVGAGPTEASLPPPTYTSPLGVPARPTFFFF